ncbi:helix-turn-helix transcriptional regulator [Amycolatopsis sp. NPDC051903]|uniref:helix-turn-helix transcriptional regulator n=1 Tax=Amycolatopsis sp. NPDC051903 TaxID=3363936 RepID=UPI00378D9BB7
MRVDRLVAVLVLMQARGRVTAAELADELEVSVAMARRGLEALSAAGVPVYPQAGRGGGWQLVGGARTDPSGLTAAEAQALFVLAGPAGRVSPDVRSALRKLVRALPETFRADAEAAAASVVLDPAAWGAGERSRPGFVDVPQRATVSRRQVRLEYPSWGGEPAERVVDPWGLVDRDGVWYLVAGTERGRRTFRVDRISAVTDVPARQPDDLAAEWERVVAEVEDRRGRVTAEVLAEPALLPWLRRQFGRLYQVAGEDGDRTRVSLGAPTVEFLARELAGWGARLEVLGPVEVLTELARLGRELVRRYG